MHVPRFSSSGTSTQMDMALPASERGSRWPPWPQHHSAISISFRLDQTKTRPAPVPSGQAGKLAGQACQAAYAERSNQGGNALTAARSPSHDFMIRPRRQVARRNSRDRLKRRASPSPASYLPVSWSCFPSGWRRYCRPSANGPSLALIDLWGPSKLPRQ